MDGYYSERELIARNACRNSSSLCQLTATYPSTLQLLGFPLSYQRSRLHSEKSIDLFLASSSLYRVSPNFLIQKSPNLPEPRTGGPKATTMAPQRPRIIDSDAASQSDTPMTDGNGPATSPGADDSMAVSISQHIHSRRANRGALEGIALTYPV